MDVVISSEFVCGYMIWESNIPQNKTRWLELLASYENIILHLCITTGVIMRTEYGNIYCSHLLQLGFIPSKFYSRVSDGYL